MANKLILKDVRLSFPALFHRATFDGKEGKFEATALINKETQADLIAKIETIIEAECKDAKIKRPSPDKVCLRDGDHADYSGYEGMMSLKAATNRRPTLINRDKTPLAEDDNVLYAGARVNIIVDFWVQNNGFGKRVNCNLLGVQFFKDAEPFGAGDVDVTDEFDSLEDDTDDF